MEKEFFLKIEGDEWFSRNRNKPDDFENQRISCFLNYIDDREEKSLLEIGCSGGWNSELLRNEKLKYSGVDASNSAILYAKETYPDCTFVASYSDNLPFADNSFDYVLLGFFLYATDRKSLAMTVAEVDRVLKDKGYIFILDFDVPRPLKTTYRDRKDDYCYKMDYSALWAAYPEYTVIEKRPSSHSGFEFHESINERLSSTVLLKSIEDAYIFK